MKRNGKAYRNRAVEKIIKFFAYCLVVAALYVFQSADFTAGIFGEAPFASVSFALCAAAVGDAVPAVALGAVCGSVTDILLQGEAGYFAFALAAVCGVGQYVLARYARRGFLTAALFAAAGCVCVIGGEFLITAAKADFADASALFFNIYLRRILYAAGAALLLYFAADALAGR